MPTVTVAGTINAVDANNSGLYPLRTVPFGEYTITGLTAGSTQIVASANASTLDPYLQVFKKSGTTLTLVADNYDSSPTNKNSLVQFAAEAGTQYVVRIARSSADAGGFNLQVTNDASAVIAGPTAAGTAERSEPAHEKPPYPAPWIAMEDRPAVGRRSRKPPERQRAPIATVARGSGRRGGHAPPSVGWEDAFA